MKKIIFGLFALYYLSLIGAIWGGKEFAGLAAAFGVLISLGLFFPFLKLPYVEEEFSIITGFNFFNMLGLLFFPFFFVGAICCSFLLLVFAKTYINQVIE